MVKRLKSSLEPRKLLGWILICSIRDSRSTKWWSKVDLLTLRPKHIYGENVEKSFSQNILKTNGWNLQCMMKVVKCFSYNGNFVLWGLYTYKIASLFKCLLWICLSNFTRFHMMPSVERLMTICVNGSAPLNKMAAMPIYGKHLKIFFSRAGGSRSTKFVQMMFVGWPLTFLRQGQICVPIHLYGESVEVIFSKCLKV